MSMQTNFRFGLRLSQVIFNPNRRYAIFNRDQKKIDLWDIYEKKRKRIQELPLPLDVRTSAVFANNELSLQDIQIYGFDYDYTLASYKDELHNLIFDLGKEAMTSRLKYPAELNKLKYDPNFAVRGLHYDVRKGLLMKIDSYHNIMPGTVYRGTEPVPDDEVKALYDGTHVSLMEMGFYGTGSMYQLVDLYALPEMTLLSSVIQFFIENNIPYDPEYVFHDVRGAVQGVHQSGALHQSIMNNLETYVDKCVDTQNYLEGLVNSGKKLFLITNSGFPFVDAGMTYIVGSNWMEMFDVVITNARKPKFFNESSRPFRVYDKVQNIQAWDRVHALSKNKVYVQGNFYLFTQMTGWNGSKVLYFGDHVYSDLADPSIKHGWRTGAIIPELEKEIIQLNTVEYKEDVRWLIVLQLMIEEWQNIPDVKSRGIIQEWLKERDQLRNRTKSRFNPRFGSLFRTHHNPTYFTRRLARFADIYTSSVTNLLQYSVDHTFYPRRLALPHEAHAYSNY